MPLCDEPLALEDYLGLGKVELRLGVGMHLSARAPPPPPTSPLGEHIRNKPMTAFGRLESSGVKGNLEGWGQTRSGMTLDIKER